MKTLDDEMKQLRTAGIATPGLDAIVEKAKANAQPDDVAYEFEVTRIGLVYQQVCTTAKDPETVARLTNTRAPSGTRHGWKIDEGHAPVQCSEHPDRLHWVLSC